MDLTLVDNTGKEIATGTYEYLEGEKDLDGKPVIYALLENAEGKEFKLFFKPKDDQDWNHFKKDLEQVMRH